MIKSVAVLGLLAAIPANRLAAAALAELLSRRRSCERIATMEIEQAVEQHHAACDAFSTGDPAPMKALYSRGDDVLLANPFGGVARGWTAVSQALDFASSNFRDGKRVHFEEVSRYAGPDVVTLFEQEHWETKGGHSQRTGAL